MSTRFGSADPSPVDPGKANPRGLPAVAADLRAEQESLDTVVATLTPDAWQTPTPSPGWTIADQIAHLTYFDSAAVSAITEPDGFGTEVTRLFEAALGAPDGMDRLTLDPYRVMTSTDLLATWRENRRLLMDASATLTEERRVPWYGPPMGAASFLAARLMETWAHGQDIVDALDPSGGQGLRPATDRLRHIAHLGFVTRGWSYANRGLERPAAGVALELAAPSGAIWTWEPRRPDDADVDAPAVEVVRGGAEDFCLVVTQRRHLDDTDLETGPIGRDWLERAQAFAGPATDGPPPHSRP